jgi:hypothetical protein
MIRMINAQGRPTLTNGAGVAFEMPHPLARELYRRGLQGREELAEFLIAWGADPEGAQKLLAEDFDAAAFKEGLANLGLTLETMRDLNDERKFYTDAYGKAPAALVLHPSELGVIATALAKEGRIADQPLRTLRDEAARGYLAAQLGLPVTTDEKLLVGEYR